MNLSVLNKDNYIRLSIGFVLILHVVGLIGIGVFKNQDIVNLTWINLSISFILGLFYFKSSFKVWGLALLIAFLLGVITESIGVKTGLLFGDYAYSDLLGFKMFEVPFTIGLLWGSLNIAAKNLAQKITANKYVVAVLAALIMVIFDWVMEPVATHLHFWDWQENVIPLYNYISWFFVSLVIQLLWRNSNTKNVYFDGLIWIQLLFFLGLYFLI
ncbi:hypothetical protein DNU06_10005 [Putridiphycobacter roseus]|uniref:Carotenoid biosynthesis protein n=1 Tax=Putridiphycobacter roseus TaxID=2219161 RepID=A0A2W1NQW9_9FLAO|nr:carotenoid biosynthesis protein [Putridiphycobacter roseus]PZE17068.1 hypothetical protein DNU06_10005 [Putridiphycobacter roseus]